MKVVQANAFIYICKQILAYMRPRRDVFQAIADPTRRAIIDIVANNPANVNTIAGKFDVSRQAISLHLKILTECGLLSIKKQGRERIFESKLDQLNEVNDWIYQYSRFWETKLDALDKFLSNPKNSK